MDARVLCLGALHFGDASGYEIKKLFEEGDFRFFYETSFGSIYPALSRLVEDGLALVSEQAQDKRPDKKVYSITEKGRDLFAESLREPPAPDKIRSDFCFLMLFAHLLPPATVERLIRDRIAWYHEQIAQMESCDCQGEPPGGRFINGFGLAIYSSAAAYLEQHRAGFIAGLQREAAGQAERAAADRTPAVAP
ncbi:MAG TPA: PadR family transcriptional regulator [Candidatus Acidoferrum sp.]|nr:PadR family transcriptional regulator [Candidatus Acidoferrum sp.]